MSEGLILLTRSPIDLVAVHSQTADPGCGALVSFVGTVREQNRGLAVTAIEYHAYEGMARRELQRIAETLREQQGARKVSIVHRLGALRIGDASVVIALAFDHRKHAFAALEAAIDALKDTVPIWKQEFYADGSSAWLEGS